MKICLLWEFTGNPDEGMKNVSFYLRRELSKKNQILALDPQSIFSRDFWRNIHRFRPEIIHYTHGPSIKSLGMLKLLGRCLRSKTVASATHPGFSKWSKHLISTLRPDLILAQSHKTENLFKALGCRVEFLPNGVDLEKYFPIPINEKISLRRRHGLSEDAFIILHVGHVKKDRNLEILGKLKEKSDAIVLIIGSPAFPMEATIYSFLKKHGCIIWNKYLDHLEEIYNLSDCYIFPTMDMAGDLSSAGSIEMPLSVLEAMACNLPVICTKFRALPKVFTEGNGFFFFENLDQLLEKIRVIKNGFLAKTREMVTPYSWDRIIHQLERIYNEVLEA